MEINWSKQLKQLLIYRHILDEDIIKTLFKLEDTLKSKQNNSETEIICYQLYHQLINFATKNNIKGNLWQKYILSLIMTAKNPFSLSSEVSEKDLQGSLINTAQHDLKILRRLYNFELTTIAKQLKIPKTRPLLDFEPPKIKKNSKLKSLNQLFNNISSSQELTSKLAAYYSQHGAGKLNSYKAFRWQEKVGLIGIKNPDSITFKQLIGYQQQQKKLIENTESFLAGHQANNILLVGDSGTGKSSSIKALMNLYSQQGLRLIELAKYQMKELPKLLEELKDRGLYFIIFMDDLSFEDFEIEYKYMKAIMEGGLEVKPDNVVFYATSNRSHLISEKWEDRDEQRGEIHPQEAKQEKLSLAQRFGVTIRYQAPDQDKYLNIVKKLAEQQQVNLKQEKLISKAKQWAQWQNGRSGRTAQQFINSLK